MAIEYSLLTCLGRDGLAITAATSDVITLANHGMRAGHPVRFTTTGSLPGGISADTTYYVSATDLAAGSFKVSATNGGAVVDITSTGSNCKVIGEYWATLPATDPGNGGNYRARYGTAGSERVYAGLYYWFNQLIANKSWTKQICLEVQGKWDDTYYSYTAGAQLSGYFSMEITSKIIGVYGDGYHGGFLSGGYRRIDSGSSYTINGNDQLNLIISGLEIICAKTANIGNYAVTSQTEYDCYDCILQSTGQGLVARPGGRIFNNLIHDCTNSGIKLGAYQSGALVFNNTVIGCGIGIDGQYGYVHNLIGNVCYGNTVNWGTAPTGGLWANNAGQTGDTIWTASGQSNITGLSTTDFKNYIVPATASSDFSPSGDTSAHTSSSALVDVGSQLISEMVATDIKNSVRPSYKNGSSTDWDIGCYEFDWGYGVAPATLTVTNLVTGSIVKASRTDTGASLGTATESSGSVSMSIAYSGNVTVEVRKASSAPYYKPYTTQIVFPGTASVVALQELD